MIAWPPALAVALAAAFGWAVFDLLRRFLTPRMSAWALVVWVTVPALPLVAVWAWREGDWRIEGGYFAPGLASVALNVAANFAYFKSFQLSPISVTLPMLSLTPVFSSLLGVLFLAESVGPRAGGGIFLVVAGAFALSTSLSRIAGRRRLGVETGSLVMGFVALCWSATLLLDKLALGHASAPVHALVLFAGTAAGACVALAASGRLHDLGGVRGSAGLVVLSVSCGALALGGQLVAIQSLQIGLVETLKRGVGGVLAVVWGRAFFGEPILLRRVVAVALLVLGVALILVPAR
ncbi:MAG TPA: DMT family transporter [Thermoanaerobaculia bacterium]